MALSTFPSTPGAGRLIATDLVGGSDYGIVKLYDSTIGATVPIGIAANPLFVQGTVTIGALSGTITVVQPTASNLNAQVQGDVANNVVDSGNPVKIGGRVRGALTTTASGSRADAWFGANGQLVISQLSGTSGVGSDGLGSYAFYTDPIAGAATGQPVATAGFYFNGASFDRVRGNTTGAFSQGNVANAIADTGNPVKTGGVAKTTQPTAVTDGQRVNATYDKVGRQVTQGSIRALKTQQTTTITASTAETTILTAVASTFLDLYGLIVTNTSATTVNVAIKDATAGTTRINIAVPAGETRGFMLPESGAWNQAAVSNNWTATVSASVTSVIISAMSVQNV